MVRNKLNPIRQAVEGKRVVLLDDSIVRGTTIAQLIRILREAGAGEVHVRISAPPFLHPCYYGTDIDSEDNLIAARHTVAETAALVGADSLGYLSVEDAKKIPGAPFEKLAKGENCGLCTACFDGCYPTQIPHDAGKNRFEEPIR